MKQLVNYWEICETINYLILLRLHLNEFVFNYDILRRRTLILVRGYNNHGLKIIIPEYTPCQRRCILWDSSTVLMTVYRVTQRQAARSLYCHLKLASTFYVIQILESFYVEIIIFPVIFDGQTPPDNPGYLPLHLQPEMFRCNRRYESFHVLSLKYQHYSNHPEKRIVTCWLSVRSYLYINLFFSELWQGHQKDHCWKKYVFYKIFTQCRSNSFLCC